MALITALQTLANRKNGLHIDDLCQFILSRHDLRTPVKLTLYLLYADDMQSFILSRFTIHYEHCEVKVFTPYYYTYQGGIELAHESHFDLSRFYQVRIATIQLHEPLKDVATINI